MAHMEMLGGNAREGWGRRIAHQSYR